MPADPPDQPSPADAETAHRSNPVTDPTGGTTGPSGRTPRIPEPRSADAPRRNRAPLPVAVAVAVGWAALVSYLPVTILLGMVRLADADQGFVGVLQLGLAVWLLGHGVPLSTVAGPLGLVPLVLTLLAAWRVARAGVHVTRAIGARHRGTPVQALTVAGSVGLGYGLLGLVAAALAGSGQLAVPLLDAGLRLAVFGTVAALLGALPATGVLTGLHSELPVVVRDGLRTGLVAALLLLAAGAGAAGLAVATGGGEASDMLSAYRTGVAGQAGLTLICLAYAPNMAVWATSYLLGPGFIVGAGTMVRITEVSVGALPAVPVLAGLPHGPAEGFGVTLLAVPVVAGLIAGWLLTRRLRRVARRDRTTVAWSSVVIAALLAGPAAGVVLGVAALGSGGSLGGGRLAEIGPVSWQVAVVATPVLAVATLGGAAASHAVIPGARPTRRTGRPGAVRHRPTTPGRATQGRIGPPGGR